MKTYEQFSQSLKESTIRLKEKKDSSKESFMSKIKSIFKSTDSYGGLFFDNEEDFLKHMKKYFKGAIPEKTELPGTEKVWKVGSKPVAAQFINKGGDGYEWYVYDV